MKLQNGESFLKQYFIRTVQDKRFAYFFWHSLVLAPLWSHQNSVFHPEHLCVFKLGSVCIMVETTQKSWIACMMCFLVNGTLRNIFLPELPAVLLTETLVAVSANSSVSGSRVNMKTLCHAKGRFLRSISQCHSPQTSNHAWWQPDWHCLDISCLLITLRQTV